MALDRIDLLILKALALAPLHGYGIGQRIEQMSGGVFRITLGALYPALQRLERNGHVRGAWSTSDNNRRARYYSLTASGRRRLATGQKTWERTEAAMMRACRWLFYRLVYLMSDIRVPVDAGEFQLIDREVHNALIDTKDYYPYTRGLIADCGYYDRSIGVPYPWAVRQRGFSKSRLFMLLDQAINGVISFTTVPLRLATFVGFFVAAASLIYALVSLMLLLTSPHPNLVPGIATLIVALFFFSGVQLFFIGILGEYIGAVHTQVRRGNKMIVRETLNLPSKTVP